MLAPCVCAVLTIAAAARPASGQQPTAADPDPTPAVDPGLPGLPFSTGELAQALLARLAPAAEQGPPRLKVEPAGADAVTIQVGERSRVVTLGERSGPAAARIVALVIAELLSDGRDADQEEDGTAPAPAVTVARAQSDAPAPVLTSAPSVVSGPSPRISLTGGATRGVGTEELLAGTIDADVALSPGPGWPRVVPSAGLVLMPTRNASTFDEVGFRSAVGRLLVGGGSGPVELLAGPFAAAYSITGATEHSGVLFGGEALARFTLPLSRRLGLVAAARADVYANRIRVGWPDGSGYATPRIGLSLGVGVAWDWLL